MLQEVQGMEIYCFKGEQLQSLVSGGAFCVDARAGTPVGIYLFAVLKRKLMHGDGLS